MGLGQALEKAGVLNQLVTVPGGKHGGYSGAEVQRAFLAIRDFLIANKTWQPPTTVPKP